MLRSAMPVLSLKYPKQCIYYRVYVYMIEGGSRTMYQPVHNIVTGVYLEFISFRI